MEIRRFRYGVSDGWEINFIGRVWNLRIARYQVALWRHSRPIVDWRGRPPARA